MQPLDLEAHLHAQRRVEVGQRLVEQEDLRVRARWRGRWRRAGAGRPTAAPALRSRQSSSRSIVAAAPRPVASISASVQPRRSQAEGACCRRRSCAGRARRTGTPSRCRGCGRLVEGHVARRRSGSPPETVLEPGDHAQQRGLARARRARRRRRTRRPLNVEIDHPRSTLARRRTPCRRSSARPWPLSSPRSARSEGECNRQRHFPSA